MAATGNSCALIWVRDKNRAYARGSLDWCRFLRLGWGYAGPIGRFARADGPCETNLHPLNLNLHPLKFVSHPLNMSSHPLNMNLHPSKFMLHPLNLVSHPSKFVLHPLNLVSHPSKFVSHPSKMVSNGPKTRTHAWDAAFERCVRASKPSEVAADPSDISRMPRPAANGAWCSGNRQPLTRRAQSGGSGRQAAGRAARPATPV